MKFGHYKYVILQMFLKMSENFMDVFWISKIVYGLFPVIINVFFLLLILLLLLLITRVDYINFPAQISMGITLIIY